MHAQFHVTQVMRTAVCVSLYSCQRWQQEGHRVLDIALSHMTMIQVQASTLLSTLRAERASSGACGSELKHGATFLNVQQQFRIRNSKLEYAALSLHLRQQ